MMVVAATFTVLLVSLLSLGAGLPSESVATHSEALSQELRHALHTGHAGTNLRQVAQDLNLKSLVLEESHMMTRGVEGDVNLICVMCHTGVNELLYLVNNGTDPDVVVNSLILLCVDLGISNHIFCESIINEVEPQLLWILENRALTANDMCGMMLVGFGCHTNNPDRVWEVTLPDVTKPPVLDPVLPPDNSPVMKVLHLADTHFDPFYLPGSNAVCEEKYFCCRAESGPVNNPEDAAGKWGDYRNCDAPEWLLHALYQHINTTYPDLDFIIWTGDLIPHIVWNTSREGNLEVIRSAVQMIHDYFPGVPVFPAIGNHESHPVNAWLLYDDVDPAEELQWMAAELQKAEDVGEKVYIIGHIPPGHEDCTNTWSHQYNRIIYRYESTIVGLFYGHTHKDHFMMFYDPEIPERAYHVGYVAQSQTPYNKLNPGYRVYSVDGHYDGSSYRVLNTENWVLDLDEANENDDPDFYLLYTAKEAYGMTDLFPASWDNLVDQMKEPNSTVFNDFFKYYTKDGRPYREEGCDSDCKTSLLCRLVTSDTSDPSHCEGL
nr:sphingomyelin phosphodiesterase-like isoform X2 [Procambarus clarkii]